MKIQILIAAICFYKATAFSIIKAPKLSGVLRSSNTDASSEIMKFHGDLPLEKVEAGSTNTVRTWKMPEGAERCQLLFQTDGRPLRAFVELWCGPIRRTHFMDIYVEDGQITPLRYVLKFKKMTPPQLLKISTVDPVLPMWVGVQPAGDDRNGELDTAFNKVWDVSKKTRIQGGIVGQKGGGAVRTFSFGPNVKSVQLLMWSKDVGKKSFKAKVEVMQGPNNTPQVLDLQCGGGSQPLHVLLQTPGGGTIRIVNKKFLEDGLTEVAVLPYEMVDGTGPSELTLPLPVTSNKEKSTWWE